MVFGIFDGVHDGHRDLFRQALRQAQGKPKQKVELVVIVGRDETALKLKGKKPKYSETERVAMLKKEPLVDSAILGDTELSIYTVLVQCNPDIVCLGYDQQALAEDLKQWLTKEKKRIPIRVLKPYKPELFHSSLLK